MKRFFALAVVACALAAAPAQASVTFYTNAAAFNAAAGPGLTLENFDTSTISDFPATSSAGLGINSPFSNVPFTGIQNSVYASGRSAMGYPANGAITFTFPTPVTAFGIDLFDLGTVGATTLTLTLSDGSSQALFTGFTGGIGNQLFAGFISTTPITSATFSSTATGDFLEFDNARFGNTIPEPATMAVFGLMAVGAYGVRRRFKTTA
jgi:hypothetical protein